MSLGSKSEIMSRYRVIIYFARYMNMDVSMYLVPHGDPGLHNSRTQRMIDIPMCRIPSEVGYARWAV